MRAARRTVSGRYARPTASPRSGTSASPSVRCLLRTPGLQAVVVDDARAALRLLAGVRPRDVVGKTRRQLAVELVEDVTRIDKKIKAANQQIRELVPVTGSGLLTLFGIDPSGAARLLGDAVSGKTRAFERST